MTGQETPAWAIIRAALTLVAGLPAPKRRKDHQVLFQAPRFAIEELERALAAAGYDLDKIRTEYRRLAREGRGNQDQAT